jgi:hypothetical protein
MGLIAVASSLLAGLLVQAQNPVTTSALTHTVLVRGTITSRKEWGPPGFGETPKEDGRVVIYILKLKDAKTARQLLLENPSGHDGLKKYSELQLRCAFSGCEEVMKQSLGREATISGRASLSAAPGDYLPINVDVFEIRGERK